MTALKSMQFTTLSKANADPGAKRREKILSRLMERKVLLADPGCSRRVERVVTGDNGLRISTAKDIRVHPWWRVGANGSCVFFVRSGTRAIEFEKGKAGTAVPSVAKLASVIDTLVTAVRNGERDSLKPQRRGSPVRRLARRRELVR